LTGADEIVELRPTGPGVGLLPKMNFISGQAQIDPGDILITFKNGVTKATSFGTQELIFLSQGNSRSYQV
jgi:serine phosphatase RsbU (regulator of sigma subunit)